MMGLDVVGWLGICLMWCNGRRLAGAEVGGDAPTCAPGAEGGVLWKPEACHV